MKITAEKFRRIESCECYKTDISTLGNGTIKVNDVQPVSFHLNSDAQGALQYGLIAEKVERVYPELVIRDTEGRIQGVRYDELAPMLLSELQKEQAQIVALKAAQDAQVDALQAQLADIRAAPAAVQGDGRR